MREYSELEIAEQTTAKEFFHLAPEKLAQLIDGVMIMASPAMVSHERLQAFLFRLLATFAEDHDLGEVLGPNVAVELSEQQVYSPDILFVTEARRSLLGPKSLIGAPDLVIEILSASTASHDRGAKRRNYDEYGVQELWLIDPYGPKGTAFYQRQEGRLAEVKPQAGVLRSLAVAGFAIRVDWLWPDDKFISVRNALQEIVQL